MAIFKENTILDPFDLLPQRPQHQHGHDLFMLEAQMVLAPFQSPLQLGCERLHPVLQFGFKHLQPGFERLQPVIQPGKIFPNRLEAGRDQLRDHLL